MATGMPQPPLRMKRPPRKLGILLGIIAVLLIVAPVLVSFYTEWQWFGEVDFRVVFGKTLLTRIALFVGVGIVVGLITFLACWLVWRTRPRSMSHLDPDSPIHHYRRAIERSVRLLFIVLPLLVGIFAGVAGQSQWRAVLMFFNARDFGQTDPQFGHDLGFYAFSLPVLNLLVDGLSLALLVAFLIALAGHYLTGAIRIGNRLAGIKGGVSSAARIQLAVTGGLWMLLRVASYWLDRYDLLGQEHDIMTGASYTDINAVFPAKIIMMVIAAVVAVAFFAAIVLKDLRIPALATVLLLLSSIVVSNAWPLLLERFSVQPNRSEKEAEYIARNIASTREAYGLTEENVSYTEWGTSEATTKDAKDDKATISNIRLLDPEVLTPTFTQQQQLRNFYGFPDTLAIDRYSVDGQLRDFVVAARELDPNSLQENQSDWINRHTVYTHGNGFIAAQANQVDEVARDVGSTRGGYPVYTVSDLQSNEAQEQSKESEKLGIKVDEPRIYYGPVIAGAKDGADYAVVGGSEPVEYDTDTSNYTYQGKGGVPIGNIFQQAVFGLKYQELKLLLSDRVNSDSKILFDRDPRHRVEKVAPWLTTDSRTYPAVINGRIKWIVDGYTTLDSLPYSEKTSLTEATEDALSPEGTNQRLITDKVGYIRNSVKATVDAYDGTVDLYEFDTQDPVLKAWESAYPGTVRPASDISDELRNHFRYPEDLFKVQRKLLARYHVDDPRTFYTNDAFWSVPADPTATGERQELDQPPYYVMAADPDTGKPSFQLITPFRGLRREFLAAHMSVSSDPATYGKITVRVLPTDTQTQGPRQAQDTMMSSDQIARDRGLWESTNLLRYGNLLTLPVSGGQVLYVEPLYSQRKDQDSAFPKLLRVLVSFNGKVGYAPTISEALSQVGLDASKAQDIAEAPGSGESSTETSGSSQENESEKKPEQSGGATAGTPEAVRKINDALANLKKAESGTHEEYGRALDELDRAVQEYQKSQG
ncbi:UPF0182 family protein [Corynebacterium uropygiale]|uniref:UPF0182 protein L1O03_02780 n=1 Tax=Corynebacterium uropygiale TaxID=1775911 RepID=A0A9X1QQV9_9CORY|nr:UPF0182 family protein [Corynebacterium uropygiale]MCF4006103.1 UPF0182 family protein [Corynebacterium uropygiale]